MAFRNEEPSVIVGTQVLFTAVFRPSYARPPSHYGELRKRIQISKEHGRANPANEKIFIAASIYDKDTRLVNGAWGFALLDLVNLLGNRNVFLSVYENDAGEKAQQALSQFKERMPCPSEVIFERHVSLKTVPSIILPDGSERTKRIAYLAEIRNRALRPLNTSPKIKYDKLLFLNDIVFDPVDAVQLLFSTNAGNDGKSSYLAACAVDFINPFKFYDTFATRDAEGYSMGVPFFPWFSDAGKGISRKDVLKGKDAVRVKSCWGGMVAFDARYFQAHRTPGGSTTSSTANATNVGPSLPGLPIRFRAEGDIYWEASECCLVHADLQNASNQTFGGEDVGIYVNPFIRVAYNSWTLRWLHFMRRIERLYILPHNLINHLAGMPRFNPRRNQVGGKKKNQRESLDPRQRNGGRRIVSGSRADSRKRRILWI
ncbi:MAG: hypothetical protein Q9222_000554 [Ikaeria aurantiellina]